MHRADTHEAVLAPLRIRCKLTEGGCWFEVRQRAFKRPFDGLFTKDRALFSR
jgi:hypothetical protein